MVVCKSGQSGTWTRCLRSTGLQRRVYTDVVILGQFTNITDRRPVMVQSNKQIPNSQLKKLHNYSINTDYDILLLMTLKRRFFVFTVVWVG